MRLAYLSILFALASQTSAHLPASPMGLATVHHAARAPLEAMPQRLAVRENDTASPTTTIVAAGKGHTGADVAVIGVQRTEGGAKILGDALSDDRKAELEGALEGLGITGSAASIAALPGAAGDPAKVLMLAGVGAEVTPEALRRAAGVALRSAAGHKSVAVYLPSDDDESLIAVSEGSTLGAYAFNKYKTQGAVDPVAEITVVTGGNADLVQTADVVTRHVKSSRDLSNTPPNDLYPESMETHVQQAVEGLDGVSVDVWDVDRLKADGMGGIEAVGRGSVHPPRLIKVTYDPGNARGHLAIVGKGITFDSGGYSLKPSAGMWEMKGDMSGSATALHAALAAAELKLQTKVTAWLCLAENLVDGNAYRNGDVLKFYNGKTAEIHNTDAEGRLVLADGLAIASTEKPDLLIDIATLTGAQITALGDRTAGLLGDSKAIEAVQRAAGVTAEPFWAMPFPEEMAADMVGQTADLRNVGASTAGGMIKGALFLKEFAGDQGNWAHLDVAGPAFNAAPWGFTSEEGTGFGLRTLVKIAEQLNA